MDIEVPETRFRGRSQAFLYNTIRPHASLGYKPPAPEVFVPAFAAWPAALRQPASSATLAQRPTLN
jgi:putative transposase